MSARYDLFQSPPPPRMPPHQRHSATSRAAAVRVAPKVASMKARVLEMLEAAGAHGATDEEIQAALEIAPNSQRPRRIELVQAGLVQDSGRTRPAQSGTRATVWVTKAGAQAHREGTQEAIKEASVREHWQARDRVFIERRDGTRPTYRQWFQEKWGESLDEFVTRKRREKGIMEPR